MDRNIRHFLWYSGVASEGLRSVGANGELPIQERVLYPAPRSPFTGRGGVDHASPGPRLAAIASGGPTGTAPTQWPGRLPPPALRVPRRAWRVCPPLSRLLSGTTESLPTVEAPV